MRPIKTLTQLGTGRAFMLGRTRPVARCPRLSLKNYLLKGLPTPPASIDYSAKPKDYLALILGNDTTPDCTAAGAFHIGGTLLANADQPIPFTQSDVEAFYSATSSPGGGADEQTCLNYWQQNGLRPGLNKIAGWVAIDATNVDEVKTTLWLFENLYFGVELPDAWINPMPAHAGFIWDVAGAADPDNGHCFSGEGYNQIGVLIDTWGMIGTITWPAVAKYAAAANGQGELYAVLGPDAISKATQRAPNGFDATQLLADMQAIGVIE
jgi:hypothetical protein